MKLYGLQLDIAWENKAANHAKAQAMIEKARPAPGSLLVLPEMFATGFSMDVASIHDSDTLETQKFLSRIAAEYRINLLGGIVSRDASGPGRNECVIYGPDGREISRYCKLQPFAMGGEMDNYVSGEKINLFHCEGFSVATYICYDLRFPEIFRPAVLNGANLYTVIASWPVAREDHWISLLKARAIENQAYVIGVNRCGRDPKYVYSGRSLIIHPSGRILADGGNNETAIYAELNLDEVNAYRKDLPFLKDIRPDFMP